MEEVSTSERVINTSSKSRCASATAAVLAATGAAAATPSGRGHAGKRGNTFSAQLLPLHAGEHSVGGVTFTISMAGGTAAVRVKGDDVSSTSNSTGSFRYRAKASKSHLQSELKQALKLGERHVVIHGINPDDTLPASVKSPPGLPAWATLPVACGELHRVK